MVLKGFNVLAQSLSQTNLKNSCGDTPTLLSFMSDNKRKSNILRCPTFGSLLHPQLMNNFLCNIAQIFCIETQNML